MTNKIKYSKANGAGNSFIIIFNQNDLYNFGKSFIRKICNYNTKNRYDGFIVVSKKELIYHLDYFNCDGSWETLCINGSRCVASLLFKKNLVERNFVLSTGDGLHQVVVYDINKIKVSMNTPLLVKNNMQVEQFRGSFINSGAKHFTVETKNVLPKNVLIDGKKIRYSANHFPDGINVNFYKILSEHEIEITTYEKGIEDVVKSCASGAVACCFDAHNKGLIDSPCSITTVGGRLVCEFDNSWQSVWIEGPVEIESMDLDY